MFKDGGEKMISVVIPTAYDYDKELKNLVEGIQKYTDLDDGIEIIVVANGSKPSIIKDIEKLGKPFTLIYKSDRIGVASAFTLGCQAAKGDFVILMNDDVRILPQEKNHWINAYISKFEDDKVGIVGKIIPDMMATGRYFVVSFCMAIRRKVFEDIGYFDSAFNPYFGEDIDFNIRAVRAGWLNEQVVDPKIFHSCEAEHNPTAKQAKTIAEKVELLKERYLEQEEKQTTAWDLEKYKNHLSSPELAEALTELIPKDDLVIDIGCGVGYYCDYLSKKGYTVIGVEGTKGINSVSIFKGIIETDVSKPLNLPTCPKNTTVMSFEVGEHIPKEKEDVFLWNVTHKAKRVILSWAIPGQGGDGHINEADNDYIISQLKKRGFIFNKEKTLKARTAVQKSQLWWFKNTLMVFDKVEVTVYVSTKDRYFLTLPLCLMGVATQTFRPKKLVIFDDGEHKDLRNEPLYQNLFTTLIRNGIQWEVKFTNGVGQIVNHQYMLDNAETDWLWRIDDDNVPESTALEKMVEKIDDNVGGVGGIVLHPGMMPTFRLSSSKIEDIFLGANAQWYHQKEVLDVDHLYSTFIYRREAGKHGYCLDLTIAAHREETIFTYEMKRAGWKLLIAPDAITWHYRLGAGGTASVAKKEMFEKNEAIFRNKIKEWKVKIKDHAFIVLDNGIGDHIVFKKILPDIKKKYTDYRIIVACCYNDVFAGDKDIEIISIGEAKNFLGNVDRWNIYKWMIDNNWTDTLESAYRRMYEL